MLIKTYIYVHIYMKKLYKYDDNISFFPHDETLGDLSSFFFAYFSSCTKYTFVFFNEDKMYF